LDADQRQAVAASAKQWHREVSYTPLALVNHDGGSTPDDANGYFADVAWGVPVDDHCTRNHPWPPPGHTG